MVRGLSLVSMLVALLFGGWLLTAQQCIQTATAHLAGPGGAAAAGAC